MKTQTRVNATKCGIIAAALQGERFTCGYAVHVHTCLAKTRARTGGRGGALCELAHHRTTALWHRAHSRLSVLRRRRRPWCLLSLSLAPVHARHITHTLALYSARNGVGVRVCVCVPDDLRPSDSAERTCVAVAVDEVCRLRSCVEIEK